MKIRLFLLSLIVMGMLYSCEKKDNFDYPEGTVGISKITYFPVMSLKGERYMTIKKGDAFVDPGVTATEGGADIPYTTDGTVNANVPGVYTLVYTAVNKDGFSASLTRTVAVYHTEPDAAAHDLSGEYVRGATGVSCFWVKLAPGVYKFSNPGGFAGGENIVGIVFNSSAFNIEIPEQITSDGNPTSSADAVYTDGNPAKYEWRILLNPVFNHNSVRKFTKKI